MPLAAKHRLVLVTWLSVTACLIAALSYQVVVRSVQFDANILNILNIDDEAGLLAKTASEPYQNKALLLVQHHNNQTSKTYLRNILTPLLNLKLINDVSFNPGSKLDIPALVAQYGNYPLAFLSEAAQEARDKNDYTSLISRYMQLLSQPANPLVSLSIEQAPLLNLSDWIADRTQQSSWKQEEEFLFIDSQNSRYYPLFIEFNQAAVQMDNVVETVAAIQQILQQHAAEDAPQVISSGLIFHSAAVTSRARFEMQLFGAISLVGVLILTLISFRSIRPLLSIWLLIAASMLAGITALVLVFSKVHLLSLVFAISLIGIAVDYGYHILLTAKFTGMRGAALARHIAPALMMGGGTTMVSYLLLLFLPIPLLQQVAVFVAAGLLFAMFTGLTVVAWWPGQNFSAKPFKAEPMPPVRGFRMLLGFMFLSCLIALPQWHFEDDIRIFNSTPKNLIDGEILVSKLVGNQQYPRFINVYGDNQEQILQRFESVRRVFKSASGAQFELRGIDQWLPSVATQQANAQWLQQGVRNNELKPIVEFIAPNIIDSMLATADTSMTLQDLPITLRQLFPDFKQQDNQMVGILSYMGPLDDKLFHQIQQQLDFSISYYDQPAQFSAALAKLRVYILYFLAMAVVALLLLMIIRYGLSTGLMLAAIPILTAMSALAITHLFSGYVTIFNLLGCILILALSVDYVVFLREYGRLEYVLKAIMLSAATSGLAFGIMVFSNTPAIWQFGLTVLIGVVLGWSICNVLPTALVGKRAHDTA